MKLSKDERMDIAVDVLQGKRPESDLEKYGIEFGEKFAGEVAREMLIREMEDLDDEDEE